MRRLRKAAVLTRLIQRLGDNESWCGETHIQKATYFLQSLTGVPLEFDFILYKHGPFSFDLRDELTALRADGLLTLESRRPYGARMTVTKQSDYIQGLHPKTLSKYENQVDFVAKKIGQKGVVELERLATALYVTKNFEDLTVDEKAEKLTSLKPHILLDNARNAVQEVNRLDAEADSL